MYVTKLDWLEPQDLANKIYYCRKHNDFVFFNSSRNDNFGNGVKSIIAFDTVEEIIGECFEDLEPHITADKNKYANSWFGFLSYDLKNTLEDVYHENQNFIDTPNVTMKRFANVIECDHETEQINWYHISDDALQIGELKSLNCNVEITDFRSNMTDDQYLKNVAKVRDHIINGDFYEANFTRKFFGNIDVDDKFAMYIELAKKSPAQYGAFIKFDDLYLISSSPESFLKSDKEGNVTAQPIKGTIGILSSDGEIEKKQLMDSEKDKAENLMVVDLMRNDLSKSCEVGSVKVDKIFEITSYPHLHHLSSIIEAKKKKEVSNVDLLSGCFPPGSMTGAPKIIMMDRIAKLENFKRGIYSGAIGYFAGDGSFDFSVVIRTIIVKGNKFEFQVGGAVVFDSVPELELEETKVKAKKICEILGLNSLDYSAEVSAGETKVVSS